ncbi:MAG: NapC/NirT family cytochrome c [Deltaproteobacteria bacterium]|nr:NapC/NirT family cytochrome c [Deltaproteobacteria bacterium]
MTWEWWPLVITRATDGVDLGEPGLHTVRAAALALCLLALGVVAYHTLIRPFFGSDRMEPSSRLAMLIGFLFLSPLAYVVNAGLAITGAKPVSFCASCHVMDGYVQDLQNPDSEHLASLHYQFRWINDHQCYTCHSDYGLFGDVQAKIAGLRHVWFNTTGGYELPLKIRGTYNNERCLFCHEPVKAYREVPEHEKNAAKIATSERSCIGGDCHVSPHPKAAANPEAATKPEAVHDS